MKTIGERITFLREERKISQKELANKIGTTVTTLSRYENGLYEPKADVIRRLALALDTTSDFLVGLCTDFRKADEHSLCTDLSSKEYKMIEYYRELKEPYRECVNERIIVLHS